MSSLLVSIALSLVTFVVPKGDTGSEAARSALLDTRVNCVVKQADLVTALKLMGKHAHLSPWICAGEAVLKRRADYRLEQKKLGDALDAICKPRGLEWSLSLDKPADNKLSAGKDKGELRTAVVIGEKRDPDRLPNTADACADIARLLASLGATPEGQCDAVDAMPQEVSSGILDFVGRGSGTKSQFDSLSLKDQTTIVDAFRTAQRSRQAGMWRRLYRILGGGR